MKSKYIIPAFICLMMSAATTSCIDDKSDNGGRELPTLSVIVPNPDQLPEVDFNYGENCVISPQVKYDGNGTLSYEWSIATFNNGIKGRLEVVSDQPTLTHFFPQGGSYLAHLRVTDGVVGAVQEYQVNINRTFEIGYIVVSNDTRGIGNLTFIKNRTTEEIESGTPATIMEHSIERVNENFTEEPLVGALILQLSWPQSVTRVAVSTDRHCHFLDPNTFVTAASIDYNSITPGFKATQFIGDAAYGRAFDSSTHSFVTVHANDMFGYEESDYKGHGFDVVFSGSYVMWGNRNFENYFVKRSPLEIIARPYSGWKTSMDLTTEDGALFADEELIVVFMGEAIPNEYGSSYPCYVITRNTKTGKYYTSHIDGCGAYSTEMTLASRAEMNVDDDSALPATESIAVPSDTYHRTYFYNGNHVYVMLMENHAFNLPGKEQYCLSYPEGHEVTFMTINTDTDELIVATCDNSTGRGSVYVYDAGDVRTNNPNPTPKMSYPDCTDRVSQIIFKPRVAN